MSTEPSSWQDLTADAITSTHLSPTPSIDVAALANQQGVTPIDDPDVLRGDFWPENESLDDFLISFRASRSDTVR